MATKKKSTKRKVTSKKKEPGKKGTKSVKKKTSSKTKVRKNVKAKTKIKEKTKAKTKIKAKTKEKKQEQLSQPRTIKPKKVAPNPEGIKIRKQLVLNQQELLSIIQANQSTERHTTESNFSNEIDMASDLEGREMMFQLTSRDRNELKRIQEAIYKIDHGIYGICESCSKKISAKRLKILPLSSLCIECKEAMEQA